MRTFGLQRLFNVRAGLAVVAGLAWAAAFPGLGWAGLAWVAPALMLAAALGVPRRGAFALGYLAGLTHYLVSLHWLLFNPFPAGAVAGWLALSAYLALYPAVWVWWCVTASPAGARGERRPDSPELAAAMQPEPRTIPAAVWRLVRPFVTTTWARRLAWCLACSAMWVGLEMARARLLTGFPWNLLGVSQQPLAPLVQMASVTGVYGLSFLVVWGSTALFCAGAKLAGRVCGPPEALRTQAGGSRWALPTPSGPSLLLSLRLMLFTDLALPLLTVALLTFAGGARLMSRSPAGPELTIALVQPSIPQRLIFDRREATNRFNRLMELTRLALAAKPDLLVWPEASLPSFEESHFRALTNLIAAHHVWMVFGADDAERRAEAGGDGEYAYYNGAFLFDPQARFVATYRKRHLVIFGEYIPLERVLPFTKYLTPIEGSFSPGRGPVRFETTNPRAVTSTLICFEDVFPHLVGAYVEADTDFLLNLTNDAWFGESAAQWQHAANAAFRAVENGLPLVRCTNNGLTCWIDDRGRMHEAGFGEGRGVYAAGFKLVHVPLLPRGQERRPTFYRQHGDWFGWACVVISLGWLPMNRGCICRAGVSPHDRPRAHRPTMRTDPSAAVHGERGPRALSSAHRE